MPDLHQMLLNTDLDFLQRVARFWGIDLPISSFSEGQAALESGMVNANLAAEIVSALPEEAAKAWQALLQNNGIYTAAQFTRLFGEIRIFGEAKRKREQPDLSPASPAEALWYRGLIGRSFLNLPPEPQEYIYIPQELLNFFSSPSKKVTRQFIRPATDFEHKLTVAHNDLMLDRLTTVLCEIRKGKQDLSHIPGSAPFLSFCGKLLECLGLFDNDRSLDPEKVKSFLEMQRTEALRTCFTCWRDDVRMNDLRMLPDLEFEGSWLNDPQGVKQLVLQTLAELDADTWWSLSSLVSAFKERQPDFQRPAGDYDSWFIRRAGTEEYLRGFEHWEEIDGALLRHLVSGPLFWLGYVELGYTEKKGQPTSFRLSSRAGYLSGSGEAPKAARSEEAITFSANGSIHLPHSAARTLRYQVGRFGQLSTETAKETVYTITAASLKAAEEQGLKASQLLTLLRHAQGKSMPAAFSQMLERWDKSGAEIRLEKSVLLRVTNAKILSDLQQHPQAARLIQEILSPQIAVIKPGSEQILVKILSDLGYIADCELIV